MANPPEKHCPRCGKVSDATPARRVHYNYLCRACDVKQVLAWRAAKVATGSWKPVGRTPEAEARRYQADRADPIKHQRWKARSLARSAIASGRLIRQPCEACGAQTVEAHHDDYSQPLNVRWLCPTHHREHHAAERAARRIAA